MKKELETLNISKLKNDFEIAKSIHGGIFQTTGQIYSTDTKAGCNTDSLHRIEDWCIKW